MYDYSFALWSIVWKKLLSLTVYLLTQVYKSSHVYRETRKPKQSGRDEYVGELCKSVVFSFGNYKSNKDNDRSSKSYDPKIHDRLLYRFEIYGSSQNDCVFYTSLVDTWSNGNWLKIDRIVFNRGSSRFKVCEISNEALNLEYFEEKRFSSYAVP